MRPERDAIRRRRTLLAGRRAETIALLWLALKGYRVLARRYAVRGGEIDLVLRRGDIVAFVEVKVRPTLAEAMAAVTPSQSGRIAQASAVWLARNPWAVSLTRRGDIVALAPWRPPVHLQDAITLIKGD